MSGSNTLSAGLYGTQNVAAAINVPGGRNYSVSWIDSSGNLWLFGGQGLDSVGTSGLLNDLWKFNPTTKEWTWVSGSTTLGLQVGLETSGAPGVYGTQGVPAANNVPGARWGSVSWIDSSDNLWLFGGQGIQTQQGTSVSLNDLWEFSPSTEQWTWVSGSNAPSVGAAGMYGTPGVYGTEGVAAKTNVPGSRNLAVSWIDSSGNFWLFGGRGYDSTGSTVVGSLNDLWEFNPSSRQWAWISGSSTFGGQYGQAGIYGILGKATATNVPGGRLSSVSWIDSSGNLWLFGGDAFDSSGIEGNLNDLWRYQP